MQTLDVDDWPSFEKKLQELQRAEVSAGSTAEFLFRGVTDSTFPLATTLERRAHEGIQICDYFKLILELKPQIESFTGASWETPKYRDVEKSLQDYNTFMFDQVPDPPTYSYMLYLRHHGFPSPLLDWTRSPYIAAFFAFRSATKPANCKVSIYVLLPNRLYRHTKSNGKPWIRRIGPYVTTHRRHFLQQGDYTMCAVFNIGEQPRFSKHEDVVFCGDTHPEIIWKLNIPWAERLKVLKTLDSYNLNEFSLFESVEALMETLAVREIEFGAKRQW